MDAYAPASIQQHLYESFLHGATADVSLRCYGVHWAAAYNLHRVLLIQSTFFRTMFTGGFSEESGSTRRVNGVDIIELRFDDPNITRPAFEVCLSRLYAGGPPIFLSPDNLSTQTHPLTRSFPYPSSKPTLTPSSHQSGTPRFLLSLLATSIYLSMPAISAQALGLIMLSIGPRTVMRYLKFAIGEGIGDIESPDDARTTAVGLERVGKELDLVSQTVSPTRPPLYSRTSSRAAVSRKTSASNLTRASTITESVEKSQGMPSDDENSDHDQEPIRFSTLPSPRHYPDTVDRYSTFTRDEYPFDLDDEFDAASHYTLHHTDTDGKPHFSYGILGNQIGEACACWLSRWGVDMLQFEEDAWNIASSSTSVPSSSSLPPTSAISRSVPLSSRRPLAPTVKNGPSYAAKDTIAAVNPPAIWAPEGLSTRWIVALISSDTFFIRNELERYRFALKVYRFRKAITAAKEEKLAHEQGELRSKRERRRIERESELEQREWDVLFRHGIYFSHLTFSELQEIRKDGFVPLETLALAHWNHSSFRQLLLTSGSSNRTHSSSTASLSSFPISRTGSPALPSPPLPNNGTTSSPPSSSAARELGIIKTTAEIKAELIARQQGHDDGEQKSYFPVFTDGSYRAGDYMASAFTDPEVPPDYTDTILFTSESLHGENAQDGGESKVKHRRKPVDERRFFGLVNGRRTAEEVVSEDPSGQARWTEYEPNRCSVEYWGVENLKEKARMHSQTVSYAGSWFNVYVQVVRKRGLQLGLYLHRQSMVDPIPIPSSPPRSQQLTSSSSVGSLSTVTGSTASSNASPYNTLQSTRYNPYTGSVSTSPPASAVVTPRLNSQTLPNTPTLTTTTTPFGTTYTTSYFRSASPIISGSSSNAPSASYRDPRTTLRAYFSIACASATGTGLTQFSSGCDNFSISQSWGWKSSSCLEIPAIEIEGGRGGKDGEDDAFIAWKKQINSVRAMVIIGVV